MTDYRFSHLVVTKHGGVLDVVLNRPGARNAINRVMDTEFNRCLDLAAADREVRAVMIRGNGAVFSAGSITYASALLCDPATSRITANVLQRFLA